LETNLRSAEKLRLVHHHPGYLRVQAKIFLDVSENNSALVAARATAESIPGVLKCSHSPTTGSFVVEYRPDFVDVADLAEKIASNTGLDGVVTDIHSSFHRKELINSVLDAIQDVNQIIFKATQGKADLREIIPGALLLNSGVAFILGENRGRLPSWDSSLYRSYRIFVQFHRREVRKREKRERKNGESRSQDEKGTASAD